MKLKRARNLRQLPLNEKNLSVLKKRAQSYDAAEVYEILDLHVSNLCRYVPAYRQTREVDLLGEVKLTAEAIYALADELEERRVDEELSEVGPSRQRRDR